MKNPLNIHWKHYILPAGIGLVSVWTMYLGTVALFQPLASPAEEGVARPVRLRTDEGKLAHGARVARQGAKSGVASDQPSSQADKTLAKLATGKPAHQAAKSPTVSIKGPVDSKNKGENRLLVRKNGVTIHAEDSRAVLMEQIMAEAFSLAMRSDRPWLNLIAIAKVQHRRGEKEAARDILLMAEKMAADPDDQAKASASVREVVKVMLSQRLHTEGVAALQNIQNSGERERAISDVAAWSARQGRVDIARGLMSQIVNAASRDVALVAIAESEAAYEGASVAMQTVSSIVSLKMRDDAYRRIALKRAILNDFSWADQAVQLVQNDRLKNSTLAALARQRVRSGDSVGGLNTLQYVNDPVMADTAWREVSSDLARLGEFSLSAYVATRIRSEDEKSYALEQLSIEQARSGDLSGSLVRTSAIPVKKVRERALKSVSAVTADIGEPARARNVAVRINSSKERNRAYRAIAQASAIDGNHTAAYNTLQEIDRPDEKALALVSMARARQRQGDPRQALSLLEDAGRVANEVTSVSTLDRIQSDMAVAYAEREESSRSLLLAENITSPSRRDATYGSLARTLMGKQDLHAAQLSVQAISSRKLRLKAGDDVAKSFARRVTPKNAVRSSRVLGSSRQRIIFLLEVSRKT